MSGREIVTLQLGHYSNYIGTHLWNIQESTFEYNATKPSEIHHDVFFREGLTPNKQVTYTPRLLLVDLKGSLKSLPKENSLYERLPDPKQINVDWEQPVDVQSENKEEKVAFQQDLDKLDSVTSSLNAKKYDFEKDVRVWSDFLYTRFHPRTVNVINEYDHNEIGAAFDVGPMGAQLWKTEAFQDSFSDKIRNYVEECDSLQGFNIIFDANNGFSGLSTLCLEYLKDEYEKTNLVFPVIPPHYSDYNYTTDEEKHKSIIKDSIRVLNIAFCFESLRENSSLFVPLCTAAKGWRSPSEKREFHHVSYNDQLMYHSSAILATALDTLSLKCRLRGSNYSLRDLSKDLTPHQRMCASASLCMPFSLNIDSDLIDCLDKWDGPLTQSITPNCSLGRQRMMQLYTIRGIPETRLKSIGPLASKQKDMPAFKCNSVKEMLQYYLECTTHASANGVTVVEKPLPLKTPFPQLFDKRVGYNGNIIAKDRPDDMDVDSAPIMAGLHSGSHIGEMLESLHTEANKIKFKKFHQFSENGVEFDEYTECLDQLFDFRECYEDNYLL